MQKPETVYQPTPRDLIQLALPVSVKVSPDGARIAFGVRAANWRENCYEITCYVHSLADRATHPINRSGSAEQFEWVNDDTLAILKQESGEDAKAQVWLYENLMGEGWAVTDHTTGVESFKVFADGLLFLARDPERDENKPRIDRFGKYTHFEQEPSASALYYVGLDEMKRYQARVKSATEDEANAWVKPVVELSRLFDTPRSIREIVPSPQGDAVYLTCWPRDDLVYRRVPETYRIALDAQQALAAPMARAEEKHASADDSAASSRADAAPTSPRDDRAHLGTLARLPLPSIARIKAVSPDGRTLLIAYQDRDEKMYTQEDLWLLDVEAALRAPDAAACAAQMRNITATFDREAMELHWTRQGIFGSYEDGVRVRVARFQEDGAVMPLDFGEIFPQYAFHIADTGPLALVGGSAHTIPEVYTAEAADTGPTGSGGYTGPPLRLTDLGNAVADWALGEVETICWRSKDGAEIEGVLRKPANFDPNKKYPLVFLVHGGPRSASLATLLAAPEDVRYYPTVQLLNRGVLILKPNYRGSTGYGQAFLDLNVNNLGVGDLWDLESAIDHLDAQGWIDPERVGCMGWSQGGYISAFAALHSDRFKAVSVGAGIADWYTYHISNDIPDFTVDYLSGSPFRDREQYVKTSPIANVANARTPMLIQHGSEDRRVPPANAFELYRGLKEMGVPVELFIFPGMGHPITRPRENHAVMHQNLAWFCHYLLGDELALE